MQAFNTNSGNEINQLIIKSSLLAFFWLPLHPVKEAGEGEPPQSQEKWIIWLWPWFCEHSGHFSCKDEDVYIIYGDHATYDNDYKTSYDGT